MQGQPAARRTRRPLIFAAALISMFMAAIEQTIVATSLPTIIAELGGFQSFSWVFAIYLLTQAASIPIFGKLADIFGRKRVYFFGAGIFLAGSTLAGFAPSMFWLILFRAFQGIGAGSIVSVPITIIGDLYTAEERAKVQGSLSSIWGISAVIGPAIGAFLVEHAGWQYVFWVNLPVGVAAIGLLAFFFHEEVRHRNHQVDYLGAILLVIGVVALMLALIQGAVLPQGVVGGLVVAAAVALGLFYRVEQRAREPAIPLGLFRHRVLRVTTMGQLTTGAVMIAVTSFVPTYVQGVLGQSALVAGFALAVMSLGWSLSGMLCARLMVVASFRINGAAGAAVLIAGALVLARLTPTSGVVYAGFGSLLIGVGMGFTNTTNTVAGQASVDWSQRGVATSLNIFMRTIGQAFGAALFGAILNFGIAREIVGDPDILNRLMEPALRRAIDPVRLAELSQAIASSLTLVYLIVTAVAVGALAIALRMPRALNARNAAPDPV